jgi:FAD/FMN-containing dehydrogenase
MTEAITQLPKRPTTTAEFADLIRNACAAGNSIRFAGSDALPLTRFPAGRSVQTFSTLRLNKVIEHAVADMTVIVQAGISLEALQRHLAWQNQWLPVDPPSYRGRSPGDRTLGGLIASNSLGPLRMGFGDWRLLIMGMTWIDGAGNIIKGGGRTVKNVAGYSSPRMLIGSCGALGAIAEVTLRTFARPADEQCVILFCPDARRAEALLGEILLSPVNPAYIEAVGGRTFSGNPLQLPTMHEGLAIVVGFLDRPNSCAAQIEMVRGLPAAGGLESMSQTAAQAGRLRLWLTTEPVAGGGNGAGFRLHMTSSQIASAVTAIESAAAASVGTAWVAGEAANGVVRVVLSAPDPQSIVAPIAAAHGATFFQTQGAAAESATVSDFTSRLKAQFDPAGILGYPPGAA